MNPDQFSAIKDAISIIDENIKKDLDLDQLSKKVSISKYHLHRLFKSITGRSLMAYVRGRRLSMSILDLMNTDLNIIDIANEYQFEYEQSFIRAFKQQFGMTPAHFRKVKCEVQIEQKIDVNHLYNIEQGLMLKPRMCIKPQFHIQGLKSEIIHEENYTKKTTNQQAMKLQEEYLPQIRSIAGPPVYFGLVLYTDNPQYSNYYLSGVEALSACPEVPGLSVHTIPTHQYAVFRYLGLHSPYDVTFQTLFRLYGYIDEWKNKTAYQQAAPFHFERMDFNVCGASYCEMDIYVPVCAK